MNYTTMYRFALFTMTALLLSSFPLAAQTALPNLMAYQAYVTDDSNNELASDGATNYDVIFRIYDATSGGNIVWAEKQIVTIFKGNFSVLLGNGQKVGDEPKPTNFDSIFDGQERYLGIKVADNNEFTPRQRILPNAYAYRARVAESLGGNSTVISLDGTSTNLSGSLNVSEATSLDSTLNVTKHTWLGGFSSSRNSDLMGNLRVGIGADASRTDNPDATGYDVTFYSRVGDAKMWWDQDERQLRLDGGSRLYVHGKSVFDGNALFKGHVDIRNNFYVGVNNQGNDVKFFGRNNAYVHWDESHNNLVLATGAKLYVNGQARAAGGFRADGKTEIFGTLSLSSTADFNGTLDVDGYTNLDGFTSDGNTAINGDQYIKNNLNVDGHTHTDGLTCDGHLDLNGGINVSGYSEYGMSDHYGQVVCHGNFAAKRVIAYSDRRLKNNINNLEDNILDKVVSLRPVTYEWKESKETGKIGGINTGFIAQEVEEIFPELVTEVASPPGKEETSYKGLQMSSFPAITVKAISELRAEKDAQIDALKEANSALKSRLDRLEALLEERVSGATNGSN